MNCSPRQRWGGGREGGHRGGRAVGGRDPFFLSVCVEGRSKGERRPDHGFKEEQPTGLG